MTTLSAANEARLQKSLSKLYRFDGIIMTLGKYLEENKYTLVEQVEPKIQYNRHKFNLMDYREQAEYERKLEQKVTRYYAKFSDGLMIQVPALLAKLCKEKLEERAAA